MRCAAIQTNDGVVAEERESLILLDFSYQIALKFLFMRLSKYFDNYSLLYLILHITMK